MGTKSSERLGPYIVGTGRRLRYPPGFFDKLAINDQFAPGTLTMQKPRVTELGNGCFQVDYEVTYNPEPPTLEMGTQLV